VLALKGHAANISDGRFRIWVGPDQESPSIPSCFHVLPKRWIVERTFAWANQNRRLSTDYERLPASSETFMYVAIVP